MLQYPNVVRVIKKYTEPLQKQISMLQIQVEGLNQQYNSSIVSDNLSSDWVKFEDKKPPHEVVLAACNTYDCGWTMDTVWWHEDKQCWMTTGSVESTKAHLPYTHWRKLPSFPNES